MSETPMGPERLAEHANRVAVDAAAAIDAVTKETVRHARRERDDALTELEFVSAERDRYRSAWKSARERSEIDSREAAYWMPLAWRRDEDASRLRTELAAERKRAAELREREAVAHGQLAAAVGVASSMVWPDLVARVAELTARPSRAEVLRAAAPEMDEHCEKHGVLGVGNRLRRMADDTEQGETGGASWGGDCHCEPHREHDDLTLPASYLHQVGCPVADREEREVRRG